MNNKWISILVGFLIGLGIIFILWFVFFSDTLVAEAKDNHKVYICHQGDTLYIDESALSGHFYNNGSTKPGHSGDYKGECEEPEVSPTPTVTPTPKPVKDYCKNFEKDQKEVPYGMVSEDGICSCAEGYTQVDEEVNTTLKGKDDKEDKYDTFTCKLDEPEVTPTPEVTPVPEVKSSAPSSTETPVCTDGSTSKLVANLHVWRNGSSADVNFFITEGDSANIYYKVNESGNWQHSVIGVKAGSDNFVSYTINDLDPALGYTFGVQQTKGCGTGEIATAVVVDPPANGKLFRFNYWIW